MGSAETDYAVTDHSRTIYREPDELAAAAGDFSPVEIRVADASGVALLHIGVKGTFRVMPVRQWFKAAQDAEARARPSDTGVEGAVVMHRTPEQYGWVRPAAVAGGSAAQSENVMQMMLDDLASWARLCPDVTFAPEDGRYRASRRATLSHPPHGAEPVGVVGTMPGTSGFTMAAFPAESVPVGSKLYLAPSASREGGLEEAAKIAHEAHLKYAQLRDSAHPASNEWDRYDACTKTAAAIWHSISALQPKEPRDGRALAKQGGAS